MTSDLRTLVLDNLQRHPRVAYQGIMSTKAKHQALLAALPKLTPFCKNYKGAITVIDWDHSLPSITSILRIFAYYSSKSLAAGKKKFADRLAAIVQDDQFPEFDVLDFENIAADEAYALELSKDGAVVTPCRLTSAWRRQISRRYAKQAVKTVRRSRDFSELLDQNRERSPHLGDLEAVSWIPPCESTHSSWTLEVWYFLDFDGQNGSGQSFLVDCGNKEVVSVRDFSVQV